MLKFDRRLLVPYLQDVCSVELLLNKVKREAAIAQSNVTAYADMYNSDRKPVEPKSVGEDNSIGCGGCLGGVALLAFSAMLIFGSGSFLLVLIGLALGFVSIIWLGFVHESFNDRNRELDSYDAQKKQYEQSLIDYNARQSKRNYNLSQAKEWSRELAVRNQRVAEVQSLREHVYGANIIPLQYRNMYAAHFLYDFFRTGQSNDLDHALQMLVLEEIKQKLDRIIDQQTEIILGQRVMLAEQRKTNKMLAENHEQIMREFANQRENAQRREEYLRMINANIEVSNFFALHDYITRR